MGTNAKICEAEQWFWARVKWPSEAFRLKFSMFSVEDSHLGIGMFGMGRLEVPVRLSQQISCVPRIGVWSTPILPLDRNAVQNLPAWYTRGTRGLGMMWDDWEKTCLPLGTCQTDGYCWYFDSWRLCFLDRFKDVYLIDSIPDWSLRREGVGFWCNVPGHLRGGGTPSWIDGSIWKSNWSLVKKHVETC